MYDRCISVLTPFMSLSGHLRYPRKLTIMDADRAFSCRCTIASKILGYNRMTVASPISERVGQVRAGQVVSVVTWELLLLGWQLSAQLLRNVHTCSRDRRVICHVVIPRRHSLLSFTSYNNS